MSKPKVLVQLDSDAQASVFDAIVAVDAGVDHILQYSSVQPAQVRELVHGAIFTRGLDDLHQTAVFVGGSDVSAGELLLEQVRASFFGPVRVSAMLDANGANTTAAASVIAAARHVNLSATQATVLAATGPVGQRIVRLLADAGARVHVASRNRARAEQTCEAIRQRISAARLTPVATLEREELRTALEPAELVIAAGAAGVPLLPLALRAACRELKIAIDLNAVPPAGIEGIAAGDKGALRDGVICYGAIGVGATKMKIHKAAIQRIFSAHDLVLDIDEVYALARELES
jgi:hypothetical protein